MKKRITLMLLCFSLVLTFPITSHAATRNEAESNNTRASANPIYAGDTMYGYISTQADIDCFKFTPTSSGSVTIKLTGGPSGSDYDLWLQNSSGAELASSAVSGNNESITYSVKSGTTYYIVVNSYSGYSASTRYTLTVSTISGGSNNFKTLSIQGISQASGTHCCWAINSVILINYHNISYSASPYASQTLRFANSVKPGATLYTGGNSSDMIKGLKLASSSRFASAYCWTFDTGWSNTTTISTVYNAINNNHPVPSNCYKVSDPTAEGHTLMLYAADSVAKKFILLDSFNINAPIEISQSQYLNGFRSKAWTENVFCDEIITY